MYTYAYTLNAYTYIYIYTYVCMYKYLENSKCINWLIGSFRKWASEMLVPKGHTDDVHKANLLGGLETGRTEQQANKISNVDWKEYLWATVLDSVLNVTNQVKGLEIILKHFALLKKS